MNTAETRLAEQLATLKLIAVADQYAALASDAAQKQWSHVDYLARLIDSEAQRRHQLAIQRRVAAARFPCIKTLDQFDWNWLKKINRTPGAKPLSPGLPQRQDQRHLLRWSRFRHYAGNRIMPGGVRFGPEHRARTAFGPA
jgi:hypothetical protein